MGTAIDSPRIEPMPWEPPAIGSAVDIVHGIRWIRHVVPGPLRHINVWLIPGRDGQVLVDTGLSLPETVSAWDQLAAAERLDETLTAVIVTHDHPDHAGMAGYFAQRFGVPVRMSAPTRTAMTRMSQGGPRVIPGALERYRETWGVDFEALMTRAPPGGYRSVTSGVPPAAPPIIEGERPAQLRDPWQASLHFGHAQGHVCLHLREAGLLVSGDQLLPTISSNISIYPDNVSADPLDDYLTSLGRLETLPEETVVLPAHGQPFRGVQARVAQLRAEHEDRLAKLVELAAEPRDATELAGGLFGARNLEGVNGLLAHGETLAHIRYLEKRGGLSRVTDADRVCWKRP